MQLLKVRAVGYRHALTGILAALLLSIPASATSWKSMAPLPATNYLAAAESIDGNLYTLAGGQTASGPTEPCRRSIQKPRLGKVLHSSSSYFVPKETELE